MSHTFHVQTDDIELIERLKAAFAGHSKPRVYIEAPLHHERARGIAEVRLDPDPTTTSITRITKQRDDAEAEVTALRRRLNEELARSARLIAEIDTLEKADRAPSAEELEALAKDRDKCAKEAIDARADLAAMRTLLDVNTRRGAAMLTLLSAVNEWSTTHSAGGPPEGKLKEALAACSDALVKINTESSPGSEDDIPF
jgi:hypothetical protein